MSATYIMFALSEWKSIYSCVWKSKPINGSRISPSGSLVTLTLFNPQQSVIKSTIRLIVLHRDFPDTLYNTRYLDAKIIITKTEKNKKWSYIHHIFIYKPLLFTLNFEELSKSLIPHSYNVTRRISWSKNLESLPKTRLETNYHQCTVIVLQIAAE